MYYQTKGKAPIMSKSNPHPKNQFHLTVLEISKLIKNHTPTLKTNDSDNIH